MSKKQLVPLNLLASATAPTPQSVGDMYFNTSSNTAYIWTGSAWLSTAAGGSGDGATIAPYADFDGGDVYADTILDADISQVMTDTFDLGTP